MLIEKKLLEKNRKGGLNRQLIRVNIVEIVISRFSKSMSFMGENIFYGQTIVQFSDHPSRHNVSCLNRIKIRLRLRFSFVLALEHLKNYTGWAFCLH